MEPHCIAAECDIEFAGAHFEDSVSGSASEKRNMKSMKGTKDMKQGNCRERIGRIDRIRTDCLTAEQSKKQST